MPGRKSFCNIIKFGELIKSLDQLSAVIKESLKKPPGKAQSNVRSHTWIKIIIFISISKENDILLLAGKIKDIKRFVED